MAPSPGLSADLQQLLIELPEHYRMTLVLRNFAGLSYEEIAETMDCPSRTVKSRLNQACAILEHRLCGLGAL